jgi:hypothetical protein
MAFVRKIGDVYNINHSCLLFFGIIDLFESVPGQALLRPLGTANNYQEYRVDEVIRLRGFFGS